MDDQKVIKEYMEGLSTYEIAEKFKTYPNKIRRILKKNKVDLRDKSEAQKSALESGRSIPPMEGKTHSQEAKIKISEKVSDAWTNSSDEERERRRDIAKKNWDAMTPIQRQEFKDASAKAVSDSARWGSKMEQYLRLELSKKYGVVYHTKNITLNQKLEVDLFIPKLKTVIEIDGPAHFLPIWGEEAFQKTIKADIEKSSEILAAGYCMIRIKQLIKNPSEKYKRSTLQSLLDVLQCIEEKFPVKGKRYIEIEV